MHLSDNPMRLSRLAIEQAFNVERLLRFDQIRASKMPELKVRPKV
jgi:hypothetical protein